MNDTSRYRGGALLVSAVLLASARLSAQHWPSFRGSNASGLGGGAVVATWDAAKEVNLAWKAELPGLGHASPIVWGDRVFVVTAQSADADPAFDRGAVLGSDVARDRIPHAWLADALDRKSGRRLWRTTLHEGVPRVGRHKKGSYASSTPATDGRRLVVFLGSEGLYCLDLEGRVLWKRDLGVLDAGLWGDASYQWGTASSPILYGDLVIVQCDLQRDSFTAAYDLRSGERTWTARHDALPGWSTPILHTGARDELILNSTPYVRALDPRTGRELWRLRDETQVKVPTPVAGHGLVFVMGGYPQGRPFHAIRPGATGEIGADGEAVAWRAPGGGSYLPSPILVGEYLYVLTDNGVLSCYEARTGRRLYQRRVPAGGGAYTASPVAADGKLFLASEDGEVHVVKAGSSFALLASNHVGEPLLATPAIAQGMVIVRGRRHLFAFSAPS
jgi:outer membrane protein assembly factor BamB